MTNLLHQFSFSLLRVGLTSQITPKLSNGPFKSPPTAHIPPTHFAKSSVLYTVTLGPVSSTTI